MRVVGLLGGSFNPAHPGHLHLSREAFKHLKINEIWWLVSPQNPLKPASSLADYAARLKSAERVASADPRIRVSAIEAQMGTRYTIDTLRSLKCRYPHTRFIWLMGADNLEQFAMWKQWDIIFQSVRIAVFDRAPFSHSSLRAKAALRFRARRVPAGVLVHMPPPAWAYVHMRRDPRSATEIRQNILPPLCNLRYSYPMNL